MEHWKRTIERANRCFMAGELVDAREAYLQALALAQVLFEHAADALQLRSIAIHKIFQHVEAVAIGIRLRH